MQIIAKLSDKFRVALAADRPPQWLLQRLSGKAWINVSWCQTRKGLLLAIREKAVAPEAPVYSADPAKPIRKRYPGLDAAAIGILNALPERMSPLEGMGAPAGDVLPKSSLPPYRTPCSSLEVS
jgi:hypothetical protein